MLSARREQQCSYARRLWGEIWLFPPLEGYDFGSEGKLSPWDFGVF